MDVLFDTINIRDLLSGHDLTDPTTPLSAPDLRLLINRLESHSHRIKSKVQAYLLAHVDDFSSLFSLCNEAVSKTGQVSNDLTDVLRLISDRPIDVEIRALVEEMNMKMREVKVKRELLELVKVIVEICEGLKEAREGLRNGRLRFAAERINNLKVALRIGDEEEGEPIVYGLMRKEWLDCFEEIQELLVKFMENAIHFEHEAKRIRVSYRLSVDGIDGVELRTVLEAMDVVGILDYGLAKVADSTIKHVITPVVNRGSAIKFIEDSNQHSEEMVEATLTRITISDPEIQNLDGETMYLGIIQVVKFIYKYLCFQNGSWIRCFGRLTWPRISELIISNFLSKRTIGFCYVVLIQLGINCGNEDKILAKARNLLLECDFAVPQEVKSPMFKNDGQTVNSSGHVADLLFLSERCIVSKAASQLMGLVHKTLKDICMSSARVALEFYHAARDSILLYEAIIPVKLERQLDGINQVAVLMHNDCLYLSQEILGLAFEYCSDFPSSLKEHAVFVDMAPRFHLMAEDILQRQIERVIFNLREAVDGADGFQNTHQMQQFESAKFSIDQVVFILEKVHIIWEPLLLPSTYKRSMCTVLDSVFSRITGDILLLDDIAAEESLQLQRLIHLMLESLSSLLDSLVSVNQEGKSEDSRCRIDDLIPSYCKIHKLADLLDMPLKFITSAWESGELVSCGFTRVEVQDFIKAIFADSPLRKECLWRVENICL
ncbi:centromere/kinetochore protein zw10 homolog [Carica papaya]|uniref:centromere/kinetochore protein zw10 homolog n=1 Tax=Carica papaya TaxID=3649 RepID=UPI000B8CF8E7|nr:centromere/kinetochore protein zw10 homolog [Carica papaya]